MDALPVEIITYILYWIIHPYSALNCMLVCTLWRDIMYDIDSKFENRIKTTCYKKIYPAYKPLTIVAFSGRYTPIREIKNKVGDYVLRFYAIEKRTTHAITQIDNFTIVCNRIIGERISISLMESLSVEFSVSSRIFSGQFVICLLPHKINRHIIVNKTFISTRYQGKNYMVARGEHNDEFAHYLTCIGINADKFVQKIYLILDEFFCT